MTSHFFHVSNRRKILLVACSGCCRAYLPACVCSVYVCVFLATYFLPLLRKKRSIELFVVGVCVTVVVRDSPRVLCCAVLCCPGHLMQHMLRVALRSVL